jgi:hypothetical protein
MSVSESPTSPRNTFETGGTTPTDINTGTDTRLRHSDEASQCCPDCRRCRIGRRHVLFGLEFPWRRKDPNCRSVWCRTRWADWGAGAKSFDYRLSGSAGHQWHVRGSTDAARAPTASV